MDAYKYLLEMLKQQEGLKLPNNVQDLVAYELSEYPVQWDHVESIEILGASIRENTYSLKVSGRNPINHQYRIWEISVDSKSLTFRRI